MHLTSDYSIVHAGTFEGQPSVKDNLSVKDRMAGFKKKILYLDVPPYMHFT